MATLYVTAPEDAGADIAATLVEERLAACVNRVDCRSTYRWEGEVVADDEVLLFVKTTEEGADAATDRIVSLHPYDVPCVERFDEADVIPAFGEWIAESVDAG
jgi:periplasmic divalent cation tolerance protein